MNRGILRCLLLLPLALVAAVVSEGQDQATAQRFEEEIVVRVIDVDIVVTDRDGNPLTSLGREDFELFEDGKPVEIRYFSRVVDGQLTDAPVPGERTDLVSQPPESAVARIPLTWVVFLDQTTIPVRHRNNTMKQLRAFLERAIREGDRGIVAWNDGMAFRVRQNLTADKTQLLQNVTALQKEGFHPGPALMRANAIKNEIQHADPNDRMFLIIGASIGSDIAVLIEEEVRRTRGALTAMQALIDGLAPLEGRLALVYVGAGFNTLPGLALTELWRDQFPQLADGIAAPRPENHEGRLEQDVTKLYEKLSESRVAVYTIYAGDSWMPSADDSGVFRMAAGTAGQRAELTEASLARQMAQHTGGLFFKSNPELGQQLDAISRDLNNYYSLGYRPTGPPTDSRRIRVRVKAEGARVRHREAVRERTPAQEAVRAAVASMVNPIVSRVRRGPPLPPPAATTEVNPLGVAVQAAPPQRADTGRDHVLPFNLTLNLDALTFRRKGNVYRAEFVLRFAISTPDGTLWPVETRQQSLEIPVEEAPAGENVTYSWGLDLSPLRLPRAIPVNRDGMKLIVTLEDLASRTESVIYVPIPKR